MPNKVLKVYFPDKCIGCELCVMEAQRQLNKAGLDGSLIRIFRSSDEEEGSELTYSIEMDPNINDLDIEKISKSCPTLVFKVEEGYDEYNLLS